MTKEVQDKHWNVTGWTQHEESSAIVAKLERVNKLRDIRPTDDIVKAHQEKQRQATLSQGVAPSRAHEEKKVIADGGPIERFARSGPKAARTSEKIRNLLIQTLTTGDEPNTGLFQVCFPLSGTDDTSFEAQ